MKKSPALADPTKNPPRLAVGIVLFRAEKWVATLGPALARAVAKTPAEILFLSAENRDISGATALARAVPGVRVFDAEGNPGFAGGQNFLFSQSRGEFFLALNFDVDFDPDFFVELLAAAEKSPRGAAFGPLTFSGQLSAPGEFTRGDRIDTAGIAAGPGFSFRERGAGQTAAEFFSENLSGARFLSLPSDGGSAAICPDFPADRVASLAMTKDWARSPASGGFLGGRKKFPLFPTDAISGSAILIRRSAVARIPGGAPFCEKFWMYFEDADFGLRARRAGFENLVVPAAKMWHARGIGEKIRRRDRPVALRRSATRNWLWTVLRAWPALPLRTRVAAGIFALGKFFYAVIFERDLLPAFWEAFSRRAEVRLPRHFQKNRKSEKK